MKDRRLKSETDGPHGSPSKRRRGQQPGAAGHGRTKRPDLPVVDDEIDLADAAKCCPRCGLLHLPNPALDEHSDVIEVEVKAYVRRIRRPTYTRHPGCTCEDTPAIITAPLPPRLIPRSDYGVSYWVEVILSKYRYAQPSNRHLQDLKDQGLPVLPGTLAGGLQAIAPLFKPVLEALYCKQMTEEHLHNDETRWEVFVEIAGKAGYALVSVGDPFGIGHLLLYRSEDPSRTRAALSRLTCQALVWHKPLPGAQLRYLVYSSNQPVALLGFGAAAWMCAPRDLAARENRKPE